jgi:predicted nucleotidyltransferase
MQRCVFIEVRETPTVKEIIERDPNLMTICEEVIKNVPVESIILCGSRATGQGISENSDYDMPVVMKTYLIPFHLSRLKKVERSLNQKLGMNISLNPLPTLRIKRAKGNLFLYKVKREGITLYGRDFIKELDPGEIKDIPADRYFSFLFSAARDLIQNFDPRFLTEKPDQEEQRKILYDAAKAIIYCAELRLLLKGYYETNSEKIILRLSNLESDDFMENLKVAVRIKKKGEDATLDPVKFWFKARFRIIGTFQILMHNFMKTPQMDTEALIEEYFTKENVDHLKNIQYFSLVLLNRKKIIGRSLITHTSVEDKMRIALLFLLMSLKPNIGIDPDKTERSYEILKTFTDIQYSKKLNILWGNIKYQINASWSFACTVIGV